MTVWFKQSSFPIKCYYFIIFNTFCAMLVILFWTLHINTWISCPQIFSLSTVQWWSLMKWPHKSLPILRNEFSHLIQDGLFNPNILFLHASCIMIGLCEEWILIRTQDLRSRIMSLGLSRSIIFKGSTPAVRLFKTTLNCFSPQEIHRYISLVSMAHLVILL